ncbi:hypothetical protein R3W88_019527 [Solanum pinnatisectum]|uniref:Uncharacterized protein n=1 Tax=Solanum pinnatisectum TaxID=50273 RepID=A0AAV9KJK5_9SOLN|nr:hypothetical protein R3W88_019527 [Solanum pinnatisectum]
MSCSYDWHGTTHLILAMLAENLLGAFTFLAALVKRTCHLHFHPLFAALREKHLEYFHFISDEKALGVRMTLSIGADIASKSARDSASLNSSALSNFGRKSITRRRSIEIMNSIPQFSCCFPHDCPSAAVSFGSTTKNPKLPSPPLIWVNNEESNNLHGSCKKRVTSKNNNLHGILGIDEFEKHIYELPVIGGGGHNIPVFYTKWRFHTYFFWNLGNIWKLYKIQKLPQTFIFYKKYPSFITFY